VDPPNSGCQRAGPSREFNRTAADDMRRLQSLSIQPQKGSAQEGLEEGGPCAQGSRERQSGGEVHGGRITPAKHENEKKTERHHSESGDPYARKRPVTISISRNTGSQAVARATTQRKCGPAELSAIFGTKASGHLELAKTSAVIVFVQTSISFTASRRFSSSTHGVLGFQSAPPARPPRLKFASSAFATPVRRRPGNVRTVPAFID